MGLGMNISRNSYHITAMVWLAVSVLGAIPFLLSGAVGSVTDALFESVSGLTTTGSSVVASPETLPAWLRVWRSLTQWVGGLGLVLLIMAVAPSFHGGASHLYAAEFSGTQQRRLHPHMGRNVSRMWLIYILLTITLTALLVGCGNSVVDSVCLALSTVSTGGFMPSSAGLAGFSESTMTVLTVFMFLSGVNLAMLYNIVTFHWRRLRRSDEFLVYAALFVLAVGLSTAAFALNGNEWGASARYSLFHIASTVSTCGFFTAAAPAHWPFAVSVLTFMLILSGAMAGSTGGGLKLRRLMTLVGYLRNYFTRMLHPNVVLTVKIDRQVVPADYVNKIFGFVFLYILFIIGGAFALTLCDIGIADAFCLAAANISNLGPTPIVGAAGAGLYYTLLPATAKWILMVLMLAGRLEIFALLAVVSPSYWKKRK